MPAWFEFQCWLLLGTIQLKQPEDRVKTWSPAFIYNLLEYVQAFPIVGQFKPQTGELSSDNKQREKRPKKAENGMVSIDDIIPI